MSGGFALRSIAIDRRTKANETTSNDDGGKKIQQVQNMCSSCPCSTRSFTEGCKAAFCVYEQCGKHGERILMFRACVHRA